MQPLDKKLRSQLENTVKKARDIAEEAALAVLEQLGVGEKAKPSYLNDAQQNLRVRLRAHARSLGDARKADGEQSIERLQEEVAYEHWHRMLFARFLAENNLLMYPDPDEPVAITLEECEDLAADEGAANGWELAGRYASQMLPQIFRVDSPVFELKLAPNHQLDLEKLLISLPTEVFTASDSLGWVYQFWQANNKERINKSEVKIGARELPAVTQLFTEPYMVSFLLDNSLGAWWAARCLTEDDFKNASSEEELRQKAAIDGVPLEYLRFVQDDNGLWSPAAGTFDSWPEKLAELKTLDPCCGSGHFLVSAFLMLVPMRMEHDGLSAQEAVDAVLCQNIHGLELDQRCVELAAFALALTAWKYPSAGGYRLLPELNVACSGLSISAKKEEWLALAGDNTNLRLALEELYQQFKDAPVLGSLINPAASLGKGSLFEIKWEDVGPLLTKALEGEKDDEKTEMGVVARGVAKSAELLAQRYDWVITNVPYLGIRKQHPVLRSYCEKYHPLSRHDLATVFVDRAQNIGTPGAVIQVVIPHSWLFSSSYLEFRKNLLGNLTWDLIAKLGSGAFDTISGEVVNIILLTLVNSSLDDDYFISTLDVSNQPGTDGKSFELKTRANKFISQKNQLSNPDSRVLLEDLADHPLLEKISSSLAGIQNGDSPKFLRNYWEIERTQDKWWPIHQAVDTSCHFGGMHTYIDYDMNNGHLRELKEVRRVKLHDSDQRGNQAWGKKGIFVSRMGSLPSTLYLGDLFDQNGAVILPNDESTVLPITAYCLGSDFAVDVRKIDNKLNVTNATLAKVPFDLDHWTKVAEENYPNGLPKPYTDNPTQWIFHGHPCGSVVWDESQKWTTHGALRTDESVLHIAVARLLGYRWPAELDIKMELADEQREWVQRCEALLPLADEDGIVCIPAVRGEALASDRLINLLAAAYGDAWTPATLNQLLSSVGFSGKTLDAWLRDKFFEQHVKLFQNRPFIWHIWDGLNDGFAVLINYHKFDQKLLETLIYTYLGDWIKRQKDEIAAGVDGAQERLAAAENLRKRLIKILEGEAPLDIFVRWKPLEQQPIGWNPDLNDGVRLNIRPFILVDDVKVKGAGVLRNKITSIKWTKDRGADVESAPWYHLGPQYGGKEGDRINEHHLSLAEKNAARENDQ
ncbi:restriction endonuclease subunit M [Shewanella algae]|nr:SAM-dependent DNA methyltransferase [Shewanella algae]TVL07869.1 restriction endonuclease subunit M [Shewanella algae]